MEWKKLTCAVDEESNHRYMDKVALMYIYDQNAYAIPFFK